MEMQILRVTSTAANHRIAMMEMIDSALRRAMTTASEVAQLLDATDETNNDDERHIPEVNAESEEVSRSAINPPFVWRK
jgi:hypothetical protein